MRRSRGRRAPPPRYGPAVKQEVRFCTAPDGVRLAYAVHGRGPPLVQGRDLADPSRLRLGEPGLAPLARAARRAPHGACATTSAAAASRTRKPASRRSRRGSAISRPSSTRAGLDRFALLGISQGAAIAVAYAARHPERVTDLVLYGGYARGRRLRGQRRRGGRAGRGDPRRLGRRRTRRSAACSACCSSRTARRSRWRGTRICCGRTTSAETAARLFEARGALDVAALAPEVRARTLVMHARDDRVVPVEEGRLLAALIPGARLVLLDSANHILLARRAGLAALRLRARRVPRHRRRRCARPRRRRAQRRASWRCSSWSRAGSRTTRSPSGCPQRAHGRATPLEHLREAARLGEGRRAPPRRRASLELGEHAPPSLSADSALRVGRQARGRRSWVLAPMRRRVAYVRSRSPAMPTSRTRWTMTLDARRRPAASEPVATHEIRAAAGVRLHAREWGNRDGPRDPLHPRLVAVRPVLDASRSAARSPSSSGSSRSTSAGHGLSEKPTEAEHYARRAALGRRPRGGDRADRSRAPGRSSRGRTAATSSPTTSAPTATQRSAGIDLVGAAVILTPPRSITSARDCSRTRRTCAPPTCSRTSRPSRRFLAALHGAAAARRRCGPRALVLEHGRAAADPGALFAREIDASDALASLTVPVLVSHGRDDAIVLPSMAEHVLERCADGHRVLVRRRRAHAVLGGARSVRP